MIEPRERSERGGSLTQEESARLSDQLAGAAASGLPLGPGLRALAEESPRGPFRDALRSLADSIDRGTPLEEAVDDEARRVPPHLRGLIRAGLAAGNLGDVLGRFTSVADVGADLKRSFWIGMAYPLFALILACVLFVLVDLLVIVRFEELFRDFGVSLPFLTQFVLETSHALRFIWPLFAAGALVLFAGWSVAGLVLSRASRNSLFARLPLIGPLWRFTSWAEFCHLLAILLEARLPMPEALRLTGEAVEDRDVEHACRAMARSVERGASLSVAMEAQTPTTLPSGPFDHLDRTKPGRGKARELEGDDEAPEPAMLGDLLEEKAGRDAIRRSMPEGLPKLLRWAEKREAIVEVLRMAGETFQARARAESSFGGGVVALLALLGVVIGLFFVVIGLFLPLITLINKLSG